MAIFSSSGRDRNVVPVTDARFISRLPTSKGTGFAGHHTNLDDPSAHRQGGDVAREVVAPDHVEHDIDPDPLGCGSTAST